VQTLSAHRATFDRARRERRRLVNEPRLREAMAAQDLDAVIASSPANVTYTVGAWVSLPILHSFVVSSAGGERAVVINEADEYFLNEYAAVEDVRGFRFGPDAARDAFSLLGTVLGDFGLERARIGIELAFLPESVYAELRRAFPDVEWQDAAPVFTYARLVKTTEEIELFRAAARTTELAIEAGFAAVAAGATEKELAAEMQAAVLREGADGVLHAHVHAGLHSTVAHALSLEEAIRPGEVVHVDFGAVFAGYSTDLARNAVVREPSDRQLEIYHSLWEIHQLALALVRPGMTGDDLFRTVEPEFAARGLTHPWGTLGHSTGLDVHEGFEIARGSELPFEPGMIVNVEPSHIEPADARYHLEDSVLVTEDGYEVLSNQTSIDRLYAIA
jgi:Xaa-Pro aminopeptidase